MIPRVGGSDGLVLVVEIDRGQEVGEPFGLPTAVVVEVGVGVYGVLERVAVFVDDDHGVRGVWDAPFPEGDTGALCLGKGPSRFSPCGSTSIEKSPTPARSRSVWI
jgi:hypothetical protein